DELRVTNERERQLVFIRHSSFVIRHSSMGAGPVVPRITSSDRIWTSRPLNAAPSSSGTRALKITSAILSRGILTVVNGGYAYWEMLMLSNPDTEICLGT